jgi:DNA-binding beta-propeller fold protein YncE
MGRWTLIAALLGGALPAVALAQDSYLFYVASESDDVVTLVRFTPGRGLSAEKVISVGWLPAEIEAPHGVFVDPTGKYWYLTLGHGFPFGQLVKYAAGADTVIGRTELGMFPSTLSVPKFGGVALAANSDFHGDHVPSTVSIVDLETMTELDRTETCTMPHGSRFSPDGMRHYSACMMDDQLVEISLGNLRVARRLDVVTGLPVDGADHAGHAGNGADRKPCSPTLAAPHPDGLRV